MPSLVLVPGSQWASPSPFLQTAQKIYFSIIIIYLVFCINCELINQHSIHTSFFLSVGRLICSLIEWTSEFILCKDKLIEASIAWVWELTLRTRSLNPYTYMYIDLNTVKVQSRIIYHKTNFCAWDPWKRTNRVVIIGLSTGNTWSIIGKVNSRGGSWSPRRLGIKWLLGRMKLIAVTQLAHWWQWGYVLAHPFIRWFLNIGRRKECTCIFHSTVHVTIICSNKTFIPTHMHAWK